MTAPAETRARPRERARRRGRRRRGEATVLIGFTWAVIGWLTLPIATMIAFGFNDTT
jgi:ABC-type spermidine/putrescine transport system permease subunit II